MIVVDASAVVDALTVVPGSEALRARLEAEELNAPTLLDYEVVSALRGLTLGGDIAAARAESLLAAFDDLPIRRWPSGSPLRARAFQLRESISAYDAAYVALAEGLDCALVTRDARLGRSGGHVARIEMV